MEEIYSEDWLGLGHIGATNMDILLVKSMQEHTSMKCAT